MSRLRHPLFALTLYALAMACVEAALVVYLRELYYPTRPRSVFPLAVLSQAHLVREWVREIATLLMILAVALLAARGPVRVFAAFVYVFGLWDIGYYAWLKLMMDWPVSIGEWDVLFLIPWPWLGPWLAPVLISVLLIMWGGAVLGGTRAPSLTRLHIALFVGGCALALAAFLLPAWPLLAGGPAAFAGYMPGDFPWILFVAGYLTMAAGLFLPARQREL